MIVAFFDGCCWENPAGLATAGVFIRDDGKTLLREGFFVGEGDSMSSNVAEYAGLIRCLEYLKQAGCTQREILIQGDSQMAILQMQGRWKIKAGRYVDYARRAKRLAAGFAALRFQWVPREENYICDELAEDVYLLRDAPAACYGETPDLDPKLISRTHHD